MSPEIPSVAVFDFSQILCFRFIILLMHVQITDKKLLLHSINPTQNSYSTTCNMNSLFTLNSYVENIHIKQYFKVAKLISDMPVSQ